MEAIRRSLRRGQPYGGEASTTRIAEKLGLIGGRKGDRRICGERGPMSGLPFVNKCACLPFSPRRRSAGGQKRGRSSLTRVNREPQKSCVPFVCLFGECEPAAAAKVRDSKSCLPTHVPFNSTLRTLRRCPRSVLSATTTTTIPSTKNHKATPIGFNESPKLTSRSITARLGSAGFTKQVALSPTG